MQTRTQSPAPKTPHRKPTMTRRLTLPDSPATARPDSDGRLFAPSSARNMAPLLALVREVAPAQGRALEIASGSGEHVVAFASALPGLAWQPSDIDPARRTSVDAHVAAAGRPNVAAAAALDATAPGWAATGPLIAAGRFDLIVLINLLHLIPAPAARTLVSEAAQALAPGGVGLFYGPFLRDGRCTSDGDRAFHASLVAQDPAIGYKDAAEVTGWMERAGLTVTRREMPANNLALIARRG